MISKVITNVLINTTKSEKLNLLPTWQKFYIENIDNIIIEKLDELILQNISDNFDNILVAKIIKLLNFSEYLDLLKTCKLNEFYDQEAFINYCKSGRLKDKELSILKKYFIVQENNIEFNKREDTSIQSIGERFYELLDYQMFVKQQLVSLYESDYLMPRVLVHMPTGTGKTKTTIHTIIQIMQQNLKNDGYVVWIAHTNILLDQAYSTLKNVWQHLGNGELNVYKFYDNKNNLEQINSKSGVIFVSVSTLISRYKKHDLALENIRNKTKIIIFDEAHKSLASETRKAVDFLMLYFEGITENKLLIGLTATPGRNIYSDFENQKLAEFFEKRIIQIDSKIIDQFSLTEISFANQTRYDQELIKYFQERKILSKLIRESINYNSSKNFNDDLENIRVKFNKETDYNSKVLAMFSQNYDRNQVILDKLIELNKSKIPTIFFACSVEHGKLISSILGLKNINVSQVYGEYSSEFRNNEIRKFKTGETDIIVNFNVLTTGFDSTNIKCVFISRPTKSIVLYSQMIGRGLRGLKMGGNDECLLIDLEDNLNMFSDEDEAFTYFEEYWS